MALGFTEGSATVSTTPINIFTGTTVLTPETTDRIEQISFDFNAMVAGDVFQIEVYETFNAVVRSAGTWTVRGAQADAMFVLPSLLLGIGYYITVVRLAGVDRTIRWILARVT